MSKFYYDLTSDNPQDEWTLSRLEDEFLLHLSKNKRYHQQVINKMYRIPLWRPCPPFVIHISDLPIKIRIELEKLYDMDEKTFSIFVKEVVGKFFGIQDFDYYNLRVKKYLKVRFDP